MDAIKFILNEHALIRKKFAAIKKSLAKKVNPNASFKKLSLFLVCHETMEQKTWYPKLKRNVVLAKVIKKLLTEEKTAAKLIKKMKSIKDPEVWRKQVLILATDVSKHAHDEETKLFPKVRKLIDKERLDTIGKQLQKFKLSRKTGRTP